MDTTAPVIENHEDITADATGPSGAVVNFSAPAANDIVDGVVPVVCSPESGSIFSLGTTEVICTAADVRGNVAAKSFNVTVQDTTPPELSLPANITTYVTGASGAVVNFRATANDLVDGAVSVICTPESGSTFAPGTYNSELYCY